MTETVVWIEPVRNLYLTFALTLSALAMVGFWRGASGYEILIVTMGWAHVLLGFVFFFGRVLRGQEGTRKLFFLLSLATLAWWFFHYNFDVTALIFVYFLYHVFRDEVFIYLTTRAGHRGSSANVYSRAGVVVLLLLLVVITKPSDYRQDLRRLEMTAGQINASGWTLLSFRPVLNSKGDDFYFYLQAPHTEILKGLTGSCLTKEDKFTIRVNDEVWDYCQQVIFEPQYNHEPLLSDAVLAKPRTPYQVLGGHRVGETFIAQRDNLTGIWLYTERTAEAPEDVPVIFHLASPPLLPLEPLWAKLRWTVIALLSLLLIWKVWRNFHKEGDLWLYLALFGITIVVLQNTLKYSMTQGYAVPMLFQFVVVFHYFSWYVFTFNKMKAFSGIEGPPIQNRFDAVLAFLRVPSQFALAVLVMTVISAVGVWWYYIGSGPAALRYGFDYSYFLYVLVFHVTFSFSPKV